MQRDRSNEKWKWNKTNKTNKQNNFIEAEGNCLTGLLMQFVYLVIATFAFFLRS